MRRCKFKVFTRNSTTRRFDESDLEGNFIQYGCDFEEFESGAGNYTCLVVETDNGKVELVHPNNVIFLEPAGKKDNAESPENDRTTQANQNNLSITSVAPAVQPAP